MVKNNRKDNAILKYSPENLFIVDIKLTIFNKQPTGTTINPFVRRAKLKRWLC